MRLLIGLKPTDTIISPEIITKYQVQSFFYNLFRHIGYDHLHSKKGFKHFVFSDFYPNDEPFTPEKEKTILFASPDSNLIKSMYSFLKDHRLFHLFSFEFEITTLKKIKFPLKKPWTTASPIVLYKNKKKNEYFSFYRDTDYKFFIERLKEIALLKYNSYFDEMLDFEEPLFDTLYKVKSVVVPVRKESKRFIIIGHSIQLMDKLYIPRHLKKFYTFLMDAGLGEKSSLGFGFMNPIKLK